MPNVAAYCGPGGPNMVQALLMVRASLEAQLAHAPTRRPWLISRSGMPGTQRYAQTCFG